MPKRTPDNCRYIKEYGKPGKDADGMCIGFCKSEIDDEPCEACKKCKYCASYEE